MAAEKGLAEVRTQESQGWWTRRRDGRYSDDLEQKSPSRSKRTLAKAKTVLSPAIGGSVGNAVIQLARAQGAKHAISTTTNHAKAQQARYLDFDEVIDLSEEKLSDGVRRITEGYGADIVIDAIGGEILGEALGTLAMGGSLTTLGYSAGHKATVDREYRARNPNSQPKASLGYRSRPGLR